MVGQAGERLYSSHGGVLPSWTPTNALDLDAFALGMEALFRYSGTG
jgi:hypothetical protein